jgi:LuxR family transcriptional regulator, maltose regulon positive regulatory protein
MSMPLLRTKLYAPQPHTDLVRRPRLMEKLNGDSALRLTLISAPAGFGKTTLVSEWMAQTQQDAGWLALDEDDNDIVRFLTYVVTALCGTPEQGAGESVLALLQAPQMAPLRSILGILAQELSARSVRRMLVLDDYHVISSGTVHEAVAFLLEHVPEVRWTIITRSDPPLPLARLRARRQLLEVRAADLRFTLQETREFLGSVMHLALSTDSIQELDRRTEGWVTGLHLAGLALQGSSDQAAFVHEFSGSHRYIVDYLVDEVLNRLPQNLQAFLLQTSILERFCADLCAAVVGEEDGGTAQAPDASTASAQELLEVIENANLFLIALDDVRCWYRYHHLFGDLLRQRLHRQHRWDAALLQQRAANWFARQGLVEEAVRYAVAAKDFAYAADLLEQHSEALWSQGGFAVLQHWLAALPDGIKQDRPRLLLAHAWADFLTDSPLTLVEARLGEAELAILRLEATGPLMVESARALQGVAATIRAAQQSKEEAAPATIAYAQHALALLPAQNERWRSVALLLLGFAYEMDGAVRPAIATLEEAIQLCHRIGNEYSATVGSMALARTQIAHGQLRTADAIYRESLAQAQRRGMDKLPITAQAHVNLGRLYYERNELQAAAQQLWLGVERMQGQGGSWIHFEAFLLLARLEQARGHTDEALALLQRAEQAASAIPFGWTRAATAAAMVRARLALGDTEGASAWLAEARPAVGDHLNRVREAEHLIAVQVLLALGRTDEALALAAYAVKTAEEAERWRTVVEASLLAAQALSAQGQQARAVAWLQRALEVAEPQEYVRTFVDEGQVIYELMVHSRGNNERAQIEEYRTQLIAAFGGRMAESAGRTTQQASSAKALQVVPSAQGASLVEPLSARELELLQLVGAGYSNQEIADQLVITVGTVKSHLNHIFAKLGVEGRVRAANRARELALIA